MEKEKSLFFDISEYALKRKKITNDTRSAFASIMFHEKEMNSSMMKMMVFLEPKTRKSD